jgi:hypothetical protein
LWDNTRTTMIQRLMRNLLSKFDLERGNDKGGKNKNTP